MCDEYVDKLQETGGCVCDECVDAVQETGGCVCDEYVDKLQETGGCVCDECVDKLQETGGCVCHECVDAVQEAMELEAMMEELLWEGRVSECCHLARLLGGQCTDLIVVLVSLQPSEW